MANLETQFRKYLNFDKIEKPVQRHLKNVYACLSLALVAAAVGAYVHLFTNIMQAGLLTILGSLGLLLLLGITPKTPENQKKRLAYLFGFAFFSGMALGPLMDIIIQINPSIIATAFIGTSVIFICFTLSALLSNDRKFIFMGGFLFSGLSWCLMLGFLNIFMGSQLIFQAELYLGFLIMCGFVLYDTQLIVEKCRQGDNDYIWHCLDLFLDFINIFRRLMIILAQREDKKKRRN